MQQSPTKDSVIRMLLPLAIGRQLFFVYKVKIYTALITLRLSSDKAKGKS